MVSEKGVGIRDLGRTDDDYEDHHFPSAMAGELVKGKWTGESAFDLPLALRESRAWIEAVTGETFPVDDFQASTKNGVLLCRLINNIQPGSVGKIHTHGLNDFRQRENLVSFARAARQLGLKDSQLLDANDLFEAKRIRNVTITLYWLGRAARGVPTYHGPHLNLSAFGSLKCSKCNQPIERGVDPIVTLTKVLHPRCALCDGCQKPINPRDGYMQNRADNKLYCPACFHGRASTVCDVCGKQVPEGKLRVQPDGRKLCGACTCSDCGKPLVDGFFELGQPPRRVCPDCMNNAEARSGTGPSCFLCKKPLAGKEAAEVNGQVYCTDCLCDVCNRPTPMEEQRTCRDGSRTCPDCQCSVCQNPIRDQYAIINGKRVCKDCATAPSAPGHEQPVHSGVPEQQTIPGSGTRQCASCQKPLGPRDETYCPDCAKDHLCPVCNKELTGAVVKVKDSQYHQDCFRCSGCSAPFGGGERVGIRDGKPLCGKCLDAGIKICAVCGNKIEKSGVEALGRPYHPECFACQNCGRSLSDGTYHEMDGRPVCATCAEPAAEVCAMCKKPLEGFVTNVYGKSFHSGCFKCTRCNTSLTDKYYPFESMPYCSKCIHDVSGSATCAGCQAPLEGSCKGIHTKAYHDRCLNCDTCKRNLAESRDDVRYKWGSVYCAPCFRAKFPKEIKAPPPVVHVSWYVGPKQAGFTVDPVTGRKVMRDADGRPLP